MIFIFILWLDRKQIGIGTILNMVLVGFEIQWFTTIYHQLFDYRTARITQDVLFMVAAVIAGSPVGFGTITVAFFTCPLISWWNDHVSNPMVKTIDDATKPKEERNQNSAVMLLSHIGKRTYHTIYNALQTTETMRNNMSEYSTSDLRSQLDCSPQHGQL